jgi:aryl-alcohol dehydrogenase-like predicted oxidoreductase
MKHIKLGDLDVARIGLGAMGMSAAYTGASSDDAESIRTIHRALDLGVTFIDTAAYPPLGHGSLKGAIRSINDLADDDWRKTSPRFTGENFQRNLRVADEVEAVANEVGATSAQEAIAWLLAQGDDIAPIPGTKRVARVEENTAADEIALTAEQVDSSTTCLEPPAITITRRRCG